MAYRYSLEGKKVLLVARDSEENKNIAESYEIWGFELIVEPDEKKALKFLKNSKKSGNPVDIVVWDTTDSDSKPLEVAESLKKMHEDFIRVSVLITDSESYEEREKILNSGITFCLSKPVSPPELLDSSLDILGVEGYGRRESCGVDDESFKRILLVEDHYVNQRVVKSMLCEAGWAVEFANSGKNALVLWEYGDYDAILMDIGIPDLNGVEITRRIRENENSSGGHIPIVALTAHALPGDKERFLAAGMDEYISKPFNFEKLHRTLQKVMKT
ncbi:response regulator [bacterium]|nr:response regulator [bacterium]